MKVLFINTKFQGGGAEKVARQLYYGIREYGAETFFAAGREKELNCADLVLYRNKSIRSGINEIRNILERGVRFKDTYFTKKILDFIDCEHIDIIHFHNVHGKYCGICDIKKIAEKCKVVWTLHDCWALTGHCAHWLDCNKWLGAECRNCSNLQIYPPSFSQRRVYNAFQTKKNMYAGVGITFVTPSTWIKDAAEETFLSGEDIRVIPNGIRVHSQMKDRQKELRIKYGIPSSQRIIMFSAAAIDSPFKGFEYFKKALSMLQEKNNYTVLMVGRNDKDINLNDIGINIIKTGYIDSQDKMNDYYTLSDVFVSSSLADTFPCSTLEAMSCGTPVIAFDVGGLSDQINEECGWLVQSENSERLKDAIEDAFSDMNVLGQKGQKSRGRVIQEFTEEKMLNSYWNLYSELIDEN